MSYQSLLFCPDEKTARVVTQVLTELEFSVELCNEPFATVKKLMAKQYDAIVVDCDNEQNAALLFKSARNSTSNQASLAVAVVEGQVGVAKAFRIGANLVLTKPLNVEQSKGTLRVARGLLRKAETGRTAATTPITSKASTSEPIKNLNSPKVELPTISPRTFAANASSISANPVAAASSASFDIEEDPVPQPEPTEAAFLESIPEPTASTAQKARTSPPHSESPWPLLSKPSHESKGPDSGNNSESASNTHLGLTPSVASATTQSRVRHPFNTGLSAGRGAAAAPAREMPATVKNAIAPSEEIVPPSYPIQPVAQQRTESEEAITFRGEAPAFTTATNETKRSNTPLIAAIVIIAIAGAGYFGWSKMQAVPKPAIAQSKPIVAEPSPITAPESAQPETVQAQSQTGPATQQVPQLNPKQAVDSPIITRSTVEKSSSDDLVVVEHSASDLATETKPLSIRKTREPLSVKTDSAGAEQTIAPPALQAGPNASDQTIAGLITSTSVPVPKRAPELMRVSEGITQGLLVKKVNPVYPTQAREMHRQGTVQILANITKSGSISSAKVIKGDPMLGQAALAAVKQWKYEPYTLDGKPVDVQTQISVNFKLP